MLRFLRPVGRLVFLLTAAFLTPTALADGQPLKPVPPGGQSLLPADGVAAFASLSGASAVVEPVAVTGQTFTHALRLTTLITPVHTYNLQTTSTSIAPLKKGDICLAVFTMRLVKSGSGYGRADFVVENRVSFKKSLIFPATASGAWTTFYAPFIAAEDEPAGEAHINVQIGFPAQVIEVADIHVTNYGTAMKLSDLPITQYTYAGREANAPWRKAAAARIDKIRKGNLVVRVTDAAGHVLPGALVHVQQTRHAFGFGTSLGNDFIKDTPEIAKYHDLTYSLFNEAVIGNLLKVGAWEGSPDHTAVLGMVHDLRAHGLLVRGHNLVWPSWQFSSHLETLKNDPPALAAHILTHIKDEVTTLKGQCFEWDVVNEPYNNHDVQDILGPHCLVDWYNAAHAADPAARLFINDYGITESNGEDTAHINAYDAQIKYLLDNKAPLGGIGLQSHFSRIVTPPDKVYALVNRFARFGLPIAVTEFDVNVTDEPLKADYIRDYMTIMFSHPAVTGFVMWGFWEGDHWLPDAALWRRDFTVNPAGLMYKDLVFHQWWTDTQGATNRRGQFAARAFLGNYQITVSQGGHFKKLPFTVSKNGTGTTQVTVTL